MRDKIPNIIRTNGEKPVTTRLSQAAFQKELRTKLLEEVVEFCEAQEKDEMVSELADIQEVVAALCDVEKISPKDVTKAMRKKRESHGAFAQRIFLEDVL